MPADRETPELITSHTYRYLYFPLNGEITEVYLIPTVPIYLARLFITKQ